MSVDAGTDRGSSQTEITQHFSARPDRVGSSADRARICCELLTQPHGDGVLHVGAAGFQNVVKFFAFFLERGNQ